MNREHFSSCLGFILITAACSIGLGNIWRFPYITGKYGGASFVLLYILFLIILGLPIVVMEFSVGRASQRSTALSFDILETKGTKWHWFKYITLAGNYLLMMFYTVISGWLIWYFVEMTKGKFQGLSIIMMIVLFSLLIILVVRVVLLPNAETGLAYYLVPDFDRVREIGLAECIFGAMGQAFFTLSVGIGTLSAFGSRIEKSGSLTENAYSCFSVPAVMVGGGTIFMERFPSGKGSHIQKRREMYTLCSTGHCDACFDWQLCFVMTF